MKSPNGIRSLSLPWTDVYEMYIIEKMIIDNNPNIIPDIVISAQNHRDNDYIIIVKGCWTVFTDAYFIIHRLFIFWSNLGTWTR